MHSTARQCPICKDHITGDVCPRDGASLAVPMIGRYVLEAQIGEGGMGQVWRARNPDLNKRVAIKILNPELAGTSAAVRFKREAVAVNEIRHKNLVDIFDIGEMADGRPYFVMEHLEGESLDSLLQRVGPLPPAELLQIITPVCRAVSACHQKNIIHRDLKPENIFLVKEEEGPPTVKILDFGIAKVTLKEHRGEEDELTRAGAAIGTPEYMSPEQCESTKDVDYRSDIYALGIIVFEMLSGRTPFQEENGEDNLGAVLIRQLSEPAPYVSMVAKRPLSYDVDMVLQRTLEKDPSRRQQSALELLQELTRAFQTIPAEPPVEAAPEVAPQPPKKIPTNEIPSQAGDFYTGTKDTPAKNRRGLVWGGAALSIVIGASAGLFLFPSQSSPAPAVSQPAEQPKEVAPKKIQASISSNPKNASVYLGEQLLGQTPLEVELVSSDQETTLRFSLTGYDDVLVPIKPNSNLVLSRNLQPAQSLPSTEPATAPTKSKTPPKIPNKKPKTDPDVFIFDPKNK
jgi:serine/threonine protein kinase